MRIVSGFTAFVALAAFSPMVRADVLFDSTFSEVESRRGGEEVFNVGFGHATDSRRIDLRDLNDREGEGESLMSQYVRTLETVQIARSFPEVPGARMRITPIPASEADDAPISTFSQFVQLFKSTAGVESDPTATVSEITGEILPKASNMTLIGLFAFGIAGTFSVISVSRIGIFGRAMRQYAS